MHIPVRSLQNQIWLHQCRQQAAPCSSLQSQTETLRAPSLSCMARSALKLAMERRWKLFQKKSETRNSKLSLLDPVTRQARLWRGELLTFFLEKSLAPHHTHCISQAQCPSTLPVLTKHILIRSSILSSDSLLLVHSKTTSTAKRPAQDSFFILYSNLISPPVRQKNL